LQLRDQRLDVRAIGGVGLPAQVALIRMYRFGVVAELPMTLGDVEQDTGFFVREIGTLERIERRAKITEVVLARTLAVQRAPARRFVRCDIQRHATRCQDDAEA
jgi:hypothetical protein